MAHDINKMIYVGDTPWHGLGARLPARARYEEMVRAAGFYDAVERDVFVPPFRTPIPGRKALVRGDTGEYLAVVGRSYEVVQFAQIARTPRGGSGRCEGRVHDGRHARPRRHPGLAPRRAA